MSVNWPSAFAPLVAQYKGRRHPLAYRNHYELMVMVVLSAQDSDAKINSLAPTFFERFPDFEALASAGEEEISRLIAKVRGSRKKAKWIHEMAARLRNEGNIPYNLEALVEFTGIGRKSANVILHEAGAEARGIIVDLHVIRVASRLGLTYETTGDKIERDLMRIFPKAMWNDVGMAMSFLGREICRPTDPAHDRCVMRGVCKYCRVSGSGC